MAGTGRVAHTNHLVAAARVASTRKAAEPLLVKGPVSRADRATLSQEGAAGRTVGLAAAPVAARRASTRAKALEPERRCSSPRIQNLCMVFGPSLPRNTLVTSEGLPRWGHMIHGVLGGLVCWGLGWSGLSQAQFRSGYNAPACASGPPRSLAELPAAPQSLSDLCRPCFTLGLPACPSTPQATARRCTRSPEVRTARPPRPIVSGGGSTSLR